MFPELAFQEDPDGSFKTSYEVPESYFQLILLPKQVTTASLDSGEEDLTPSVNRRSNHEVEAIF